AAYHVGGEAPFDLGPNGFAPQNPPQTIKNLVCGSFCVPDEMLRGLVEITPGGGDTLALPGSAVIIGADSEQLRNLALAREAGTVPGPGGLLLAAIATATV